jgi:hypothetical protein
MTIVPSGNPLWLRNPGVSQYGGDINKKDYGGIGVINALTDISAAQHARLASDAAAVSRTSTLMRLTFVCSATPPVTLVIWCVPAWAIPTYYADGSIPPSASYPTITGSGTSRTITMPTSAADEYGVVAAISPIIVRATNASWDGTITAGAFDLTGLSDGVVVSVDVW